MDAKGYSDLAMKHLDGRNFDGAIAALTEAIRLEPDFPFHYVRRGMAYRYKGEFDLAIADFSKAISIEPDRFGDFYFERGGTYAMKGEKDLAVADLEKAVGINPQDEMYREVLEEFKQA